jgi:hypothetical protein
LFLQPAFHEGIVKDVVCKTITTQHPDFLKDALFWSERRKEYDRVLTVRIEGSPKFARGNLNVKGEF